MRWSLLAALGWLTVAVAGLFAGLLGSIVAGAFQESAEIFVLVALVPFVIGWGVVHRSGTLCLIGVLYGIAITWGNLVNGGTLAVAAAFIGLTLVSAGAAWEIRRDQASRPAS